MKFFTAILALCLALLSAQAETPLDKTLTRLASIQFFAFGGTGYAGIISDGEKDYTEIMSRPTAINDFEKLYQIGNPQAKCYALTGIHKLDTEKFNALS